MGGASVIIASIFKSTLDSFLDSSGGDVNNRKFQFFGWYTSPQVMWEISHVLQFSLAKNWTSFRYLGIPISLKSSYSQVW
jgi:hypothetical protein